VANNEKTFSGGVDKDGLRMTQLKKVAMRIQQREQGMYNNFLQSKAPQPHVAMMVTLLLHLHKTKDLTETAYTKFVKAMTGHTIMEIHWWSTTDATSNSGACCRERISRCSTARLAKVMEDKESAEQQLAAIAALESELQKEREVVQRCTGEPAAAW
jgi:hypothetical protein